MMCISIDVLQNLIYQKDKIGYENLNIVFTSIHGTTYTTIPKALAKAGFTKVDLVKEQMIPSGNFPTVESPNPEEPAALNNGSRFSKYYQWRYRYRL